MSSLGTLSKTFRLAPHAQMDSVHTDKEKGSSLLLLQTSLRKEEDDEGEMEGEEYRGESII